MHRGPVALLLPGHFTFDGQSVPFVDGDTLGSALHRAGVRAISRSLKYHRPRGLYCCTGSCAGCLVDVDGVPNTAACMTACRDGATVQSQNRLGSARADLFAVVDKVYRTGFDPHDAFTKPRVLNEAFLKAVRIMSGLGKAPQSTDKSTHKRHVLAVDELIVGGGLMALRRAQQAQREGLTTILVEEQPELGGSARWDRMESETRMLLQQLPTWSKVEAWTGAVCFGLYREDGGLVAGIARNTPHGQDLWEVTAERITVASGRHDAWPVFPNNDLPGVVSLRGAARLLGEHSVLPGRAIAVHGAKLPSTFRAKLENAGAAIVAEGIVTNARGRIGVEQAEVDGKWHNCDTIICHLAGTPRVELLQQAGCKLHVDRDGVLSPQMAGGDATTVAGVHAIFSPAPEAPHLAVLP